MKAQTHEDQYLEAGEGVPIFPIPAGATYCVIKPGCGPVGRDQVIFLQEIPASEAP